MGTWSETVQLSVRVHKKFVQIFCGPLKSFDTLFCNSHCVCRDFARKWKVQFCHIENNILNCGNEAFFTMLIKRGW